MRASAGDSLLFPLERRSRRQAGARGKSKLSPDPSRRDVLAGFACVSASALLPCCLGATAKAGVVLALREIAPGVLVFQGISELPSPANRGGIANIGMIVGDETVAVIDSGGSIAEAKAFIAAIREVTPKPVRYLVNTHMHPDHVFGNAAFRELGATVVGHANLPAALEARGPFYLQSYRRQLGEALMKGVEIVPPSLIVAERLELDLGGRVLELRAWRPAHTDNDLTVVDRATGTLFAGDLVFLRHLPTLDGSLRGWLDQLDALAAIGAKRAVPGHGPATADWPQALAPERRYLEVLAADVRQAIAAGVPLAEAVRTAAASERGKWALFDDFNERNAGAAYAELEWE